MYILFFSKDDVWHPYKCEEMIGTLEQHPEIDLLVSNYNIVYDNRENKNKSYNKDMKNDSSLEHIVINPRWCHINRPGCTYCFRKVVFERIKVKWDVNNAHDANLWWNACIDDSLYIFNRKTIDFRRHGDNVTSLLRQSKELRIESVVQYKEAYLMAMERAGK